MELTVFLVHYRPVLVKETSPLDLLECLNRPSEVGESVPQFAVVEGMLALVPLSYCLQNGRRKPTSHTKFVFHQILFVGFILPHMIAHHVCLSCVCSS